MKALKLYCAALGFLIFSRAYSDQLNSVDAVWSQQVVAHIGVNIHLSFYNTPYKKFEEIVVPGLNDLGIKFVRDVFPKNNIFNKLYVQRLAKLCDKGYKLSLVVFDETNPNYSIDFDTADKFINSLNGCVGILEGVNEPNLKPIKNWALITKVSQGKLYSFIKNKELDVAKPIVAGPSLWGDSAQAIGNISSIVDLGNWHTYSGGRNPESTEDKDGSIYSYIKQAGLIYGPKKILITEDGYHSGMDVPKNKHRPTPNDIIAIYLPRLVLLHQELGIYQTYIYELIDTKNNGLIDPESNFGLIDYQGRKKPQFYSIKNLIDIFSDETGGKCAENSAFSIFFKSVANIKVQLFCKSKNRWLVTFWQPLPSWDPESREYIPVSPQKIEFGFPNSADRKIDVFEIRKDGALHKKEKYLDHSGNLIIEAKDTLSIIEINIP